MMHPVDPLFQIFLLSSRKCCENMDFDIIPETIEDTRFDHDDFGLGEDSYDYRAHSAFQVRASSATAVGGSKAIDGAVGRRAPVSAKETTETIFNTVPTSNRPHKEPLPAAIQPLYPFVFRSYTDDHDAFAIIEWSKCTAANIWAIITSPHLSVGATRTMTFILNFAIKGQLLNALKHFLGQSRLEAFKVHVSGERGIKVSPDLERLFCDACSIPGVLAALQSALTTYNVTQNHLIRFKSGVFPEVSNVQQWTARIAALMVEPCLQDDFHSMSNANPSRLALQEPALRITNNRQRILERITNDYVNNPSFIPQSNPTISSWCDNDYDSSIVGKEPRSWVWVSGKIQEIKTTMST
jgi:hypothetical protein